MLNIDEKDFCDYETCIALRELGFPLTAKEVRHEDKAVFVPGVLLYAAQKWLREEHGVIVDLINNFTIQAFRYYISTWEEDIFESNRYTNYEESLSDGIKKATQLMLEGKIKVDEEEI